MLKRHIYTVILVPSIVCASSWIVQNHTDQPLLPSVVFKGASQKQEIKNFPAFNESDALDVNKSDVNWSDKNNPTISHNRKVLHWDSDADIAVVRLDDKKISDLMISTECPAVSLQWNNKYNKVKAVCWRGKFTKLLVKNISKKTLKHITIYSPGRRQKVDSLAAGESVAHSAVGTNKCIKRITIVREGKEQDIGVTGACFSGKGSLTTEIEVIEPQPNK